MPPPHFKPLTDGIEKPKNLSELPKYLKKKVVGFVTRLFYIIKLVWESAPLMLVAMAFFCLLDGVLPVIDFFVNFAAEVNTFVFSFSVIYASEVARE